MNLLLTNMWPTVYRRVTGLAIAAVACALIAVVLLCNMSAEAKLADAEPVIASEPSISITLVADAPYVNIISDIVYTITVQNNGIDPSGSLVITDLLGPQLSYIQDSAVVASGQFTQIEQKPMWHGALAAGEQVIIRLTASFNSYAVELYKQPCITQFHNQAVVAFGDQKLLSNEVIVNYTCIDFGDAPDSTTAFPTTMSAYPGITANFDTEVYSESVFELPWGPSHLNPKVDAWLGSQVSGEIHLDIRPGSIADDDIVSNLVIPADIADGDLGDDGVLFPPLHHCRPTTMDVIVTVAGKRRTRYLNAWFDWNRDGDWRDILDCTGTATAEWAVQNYETALGPGQHTVTLPAMIPYNPDSSSPMWTRVTLAEQPAPFMEGTTYADGHGPIGGYEYGETEDYGLGIEQPTYEGTQLMLYHMTEVTTAVPGYVHQYLTTIYNLGTVTATDVIVSIDITQCTDLYKEPRTTTMTDAIYNADEKTLAWHGDIAPHNAAAMIFQVAVPPIYAGCISQITSQAEVRHQSLAEPLVKTIRLHFQRPPAEYPIVVKRSSVATAAPGDEIEYIITIENELDHPTSEFANLFDRIPVGSEYVPHSLIADTDVITASYDASNRGILWQKTLSPTSKSEFRYRIRLGERLDCDSILAGRLLVHSTIHNALSTVNAPVTITCSHPVQLTDFGDAPDSDSNHHNMDNVAYADDGTLGHFPTVWEGTPAQEPSGPTHGVEHVWLGQTVDAEQYADLYFPSPNLPVWRNGSNILANGQQDTADHDLDEGWLSWGVPMLDCEVSMVIIAISRSDLPSDVDKLWLNAWFDGNRDGDWNDTGKCPPTKDSSDSSSYEWIVQDYAIDVSSIPIGTPLELYIPTVPIFNEQPTRDAWLRLMLSEQKAMAPPTGGLPDGRGPVHPAIFAVGETEDWLVPGIVNDGVQPFAFEQIISADPLGAEISATVGSKIYISHHLQLPAGSAPTIAEINSVLPSEVTLQGEPTIWPEDFDGMVNGIGSDDDNMITPFSPTFDALDGPNGTIKWRGQMPSNSSVSLHYTARIDHCPAPDITGQPLLRTVVTFRQSDGTQQTHEATLPVDCVPMEQPLHRLYLPVISR